MFPVDKIRADFPILNREVNGKPLVYFDNAATSHLSCFLSSAHPPINGNFWQYCRPPRRMLHYCNS